MLPDGSSSEATPPERSLSTDIIVLEALLEAERDGVAAITTKKRHIRDILGRTKKIYVIHMTLL